MIIVYHLNHKIAEVVTSENQTIDFDSTDCIASGMHKLSVLFPTKKIVWCHLDFKQNLNLETINTVFHHKKMLLSYCPNHHDYFYGKIGYADESPFIHINKEVTFPTWQMSSMVGVVHAETILALKKEIPFDQDFNFYLCSLAKLTMPLGVFCYSEPRLLKDKEVMAASKSSIFTLFRFVKQHYKTRWVFLLLFNLMIYERKLAFSPFLFSLFYKRRNNKNINLETIEVQSSKKVVIKRSIDVIIPTIGRKVYLYQVLKDLSEQTLLPNKIIIVEQNPFVGSTTELNYIQNEEWPFEIKHFFIHQSGVCNARNLALKQTQSEWVFLADDDNRFGKTLLSDVFDKIEQYGNTVATVAYPQKNEVKIYKKEIQWVTFGAGNSFIRKDLLDNVKFNMGYEFGYGEDSDFGMQLRNIGHDILYLPKPEILHLKAPIGGFRTKPILQWQNETIQPKPSPTILLYYISHYSKQQVLGYKTILFIKNYNFKSFENPISYCNRMNKQWKVSEFWANKLKRQNEI